MPSPNTVLQGTGTKITFPGSFVASIMNVDFSGMGVEDIEISDTSDIWRVFDPSVLKNPGELKIHIHFDPDQTPPLGTKGTVTVTFPLPSGKTTPGNWACSGYMKTYEPSDPYDNKMVADVTVKFSGQPTFTASS